MKSFFKKSFQISRECIRPSLGHDRVCQRKENHILTFISYFRFLKHVFFQNTPLFQFKENAVPIRFHQILRRIKSRQAILFQNRHRNPHSREELHLNLTLDVIHRFLRNQMRTENMYLNMVFRRSRGDFRHLYLPKQRLAVTIQF